MKTLAVLQPSYLPWIGCFEQILKADHFVFYDDVQFEKNSWRNRNRVKGQGGPVWLTVPVLQKGRMGQAIMDVEIDHRQKWQKKHLGTVRQAYAKAPYLKNYIDEFEEFLSRPWEKLVDLDIQLTKLMCTWLRIEGDFYRSSELGIGGGQSQRLLNLCEHFGADVYLSGKAARTYLDVDMFSEANVRVVWQDFTHPEYPQLHGDFVPYMSALDLLLNVGPESRDLISTL